LASAYEGVASIDKPHFTGVRFARFRAFEVEGRRFGYEAAGDPA
jgi:hypothetical protein